MKDQLDVAKETLGRVAAVFLILWFISAVTNLMGKYEYEVQFLQLAVGFHLLSRVPTAFRTHYSTGKKVEKFFTNMGWPLGGLWVAFEICRWIGWFGAMEVGISIDYFLLVGIVFLLIGYTVQSARQRTGYWAARSVLFAVGGISLLFWLLISLFHIFPQFRDLSLVVGLVALGAGFILGGLRKPPPFFMKMEVESDEVEVKEEVSVVEEDVSITRGKTTVKINRGSLFVPVMSDTEVGGIYFGEGSYKVDTKVKTYTDLYRGVTVVSGSEWADVKQKKRPAEEKDCDAIGLSKEEVLEMASLQVKGGFPGELRRRLKHADIELPFVRVKETPHGSHIKVGFIEVEDSKEGERVKIGPWELRDFARHRFTAEGLHFKIRTRDEEIRIQSNDKTILTRGNVRVVVNDGVSVKSDDVYVVVEDKKKVMHSGKVKLVCDGDRRILHAHGFELSVGESTGRIKKNGRHRFIEDKSVLEGIRCEIDAVADELIREALDRGDMKELDRLIKRFEQEL